MTTSSRTAQAKRRRRTPDGRFADELNSFGFPDAATLSAYEQQTSQIPVLQRLQQHGKITPPPITLPDGWTETGTKHDATPTDMAATMRTHAVSQAPTTAP